MLNNIWVCPKSMVCVRLYELTTLIKDTGKEICIITLTCAKIYHNIQADCVNTQSTNFVSFHTYFLIKNPAVNSPNPNPSTPSFNS